MEMISVQISDNKQTARFYLICLTIFLFWGISSGQLPVPHASFIGEEVDDAFGRSGLASGDINGDGLADLVVAADEYTVDTLNSAGRLYVFWGRNFQGDYLAQNADIIIDGQSENGGLGRGGLLICNIDGDAYDDILFNVVEIDCLWIDPISQGQFIFKPSNLYIFLGKNLISGQHLTTQDADSKITGYYDPNRWQNSIVGVGSHPVSGDFNNDGLDDLIFSATTYQLDGVDPLRSSLTRAFLYYGRSDITDSTWTIFNSNSLVFGDGYERTGVGLPQQIADVNNDGFDDLLALTSVTYEDSIIGAVTLVYGGHFPDSLNLSQADLIIALTPDSHMTQMIPPPANQLFMEDINQDGYADLILGRPLFDHQPWTSREGEVNIFYGSNNLGGFIDSEIANLTILGTVPGFFSGQFGNTIYAGDLNGDEQNDLAILSAGCADYQKVHLFTDFDRSDTLLLDSNADLIFSDCGFYNTKLNEQLLIDDLTGDGRENLLITGITVPGRLGVVYLYDHSILSTNRIPPTETTLPKQLQLLPAYPNPFNATINIEFELIRSNDISLKIFNILGEQIVVLQEGRTLPGRYETHWNGIDGDGRAVSSGIYIVLLQAGSISRQQKIILVR